jgi:serine/threonine-protein kinase
MSEESNSLIGQIVGDYKIAKLLGEGGMGEVYAADHRTLGHRTAFKVLRREIMNNQEAVERFRQEARLIARVRHQNLIDIFDIGELPDGRLYYVMEHLSGQSLSSLLSKQRLPFREVMQIFRQLCAGLTAAHQAGIVHRGLFQ